MTHYKPPVPRIGFAVAAVVMSSLTFSLIVVLPSELEEQTSPLALQAEPPRTAARHPASDTLSLPCAVAAAVNAPLFAGAPATTTDPQCKQPS